MAQSENVVHAPMFHITWENVSLVFCFVKSKGDQTGRNRNQAQHVYANPNNPAVCPVQAWVVTYLQIQVYLESIIATTWQILTELIITMAAYSLTHSI